MIGRDEERALVEALLTNARSGRSGTLVLHGEPGVGKSTLLDDAAGRADAMRILRATGVQTEIDLAFAGLHQLLRPIMHLTDRLPERQAQALLGAFGMIDHRGEDRFLVAVATLSLLSEAAEERPVLCVVEDAHWLDRPSIEALQFVARRLDADGVAVLVATREAGWPGLPSRRVECLGPDDADRLLRRQDASLATEVRDRLIEQTGGNPLALLELARTLTADQRAGREPLPDPLRLTGRVQDAFLGQVRRLDAASRTLLLVAAADDTGDVATIFKAAAELGVGANAIDEAERAELASIDGTLFRFRHPLVRAAVYQSATFVSRRAVHAALANALDGDVHLERRVWHLASAATGIDEGLARELERSAIQVRLRGGFAVASTAHERAAEMATVRADRSRLLVAAAQDAFQAGQTDRAWTLAGRAEPLIADAAAADELTCLQGRIELARGSSTAAHTLLFSAAQRLAQRDERAAAMVLIEAARAAWNLNDVKRLTETADLLATLRLPREDPVGWLVPPAIGLGDLVAGRIRDAVARIHGGTNDWLRMVSTGRASDLDAWAVDAWLALSGTTRIIGDHESGLTLAAAAVEQCRRRGLAARLPGTLASLATSEALAGRHAQAVLNATESRRLANDLGQHAAICSSSSVLAWLAAVRGDQDQCLELAAEAVTLAETHQVPTIAMFGTWGLGLLELGLGHPERAADRLLDRGHGPLVNPAIRLLATPDVVEAAVRAGRADHDLDELVAHFELWADSTGQHCTGAVAHRCRALLDDAEAEAHLAEAVRLHEDAENRPFDRARTQLVYGEWLRRARRRAAARAQLAAAYETFERLGAQPWADRASAELRATGQIVNRQPTAALRLTPQELHVVRLVAAGGTNQEVAAQLFISPRTVAYHLYKAFPKLGVASRADLARLDLDGLVAAQ